MKEQWSLVSHSFSWHAEWHLTVQKLCIGIFEATCCHLPFVHLITWFSLPSMLWRCWLGGWKGIRPVKKLSGRMLAWLCVLIMVQICIWPNWCHCHSLSLAPVNPDWFYFPGFTFLVPAHLGSPRQIQVGRKTVVCACMCNGWMNLSVCCDVTLCVLILEFLCCITSRNDWILSANCRTCSTGKH